MADRLTQLQDAVDQLMNQFVASIHWVNVHHDYQKLSPQDEIMQNKAEPDAEPNPEIAIKPVPANVFKAAQNELAEDLVMTEQKIELLISMLPGLENSERDQEQTIRQLEEELQISEEERKVALKEKEEVLEQLETVIRNIKRP